MKTLTTQKQLKRVIKNDLFYKDKRDLIGDHILLL